MDPIHWTGTSVYKVKSTAAYFVHRKEQKRALRLRRNHSSAFMDNLALAAVQGDRTLAKLVKQFDVHLNQIQDWKRQLLTKVERIWGRNGRYCLS